jgi:hypothetical protein
MEHIPIKQVETPVTNNYYVTEKPKKSPAEVVDFAMTSIFVVLIIAIVSTYFVNFNVGAMINLKKVTWQAFWVWLASYCTGELAKRIFRRKGEKTEEYKQAEEEANTAIKTLNESEYLAYAPSYCKHVTEKTMDRYRRHQLTIVGIQLDTFKEKYLGKGRLYLFRKMMKGELSNMQRKAINRCNHLKTKAYDPRFITSYSSEDNSSLTPQQWYDTKLAERKDAVRSFIFSAGAAFGVCGIFYDFIVAFSAEAIIAAVVKIIIMATSCALKANFGWNLSIMEICRNKTKASEAKACMSWADKNKDKVEE